MAARGRPKSGCEWITNWPSGGKWGKCTPAMAAQIAAEGKYQIRLVSKAVKVTRFILLQPDWAKTIRQRNYAVDVALRIDAIRASSSERRRMAA